jgi:hypothetical protein
VALAAVRACIRHASNFGHLFSAHLIGRLFLNCRPRIASSFQDLEIGPKSKVIVGMSVGSLDVCAHQCIFLHDILFRPGIFVKLRREAERFY